MRELNENEIYDLSDITNQEWNSLIPTLQKNSVQKFEYDEDLKEYGDSKYLHCNVNNNWCLSDDLIPTKNAKELFYTLENVQIDCRDLSEERIQEMAAVFEKAGYKYYNNNKEYALELRRTNHYLTLYNHKIILDIDHCTKTTITYEKFMELFKHATFDKFYKKEKERISNLKQNRWYRSSFGTKFLMYAKKMDGDVILEGYGFSDDGKWYSKTPKVVVFDLATREEVEERLKQEAIKRGFVVGHLIGCLDEPNYFSEVDEEDYYLDKVNGVLQWNKFCLGGSVIMKDGVWLESKLPPYKETPLKWNYEVLVRGIEEVTPIKLNEVIEGHVEVSEDFCKLLKEEISRQPTDEEITSIFGSREKESEKRSLKVNKVLKYLLKHGIILTPKQYKKLWKKS